MHIYKAAYIVLGFESSGRKKKSQICKNYKGKQETKRILNKAVRGGRGSSQGVEELSLLEVQDTYLFYL